MHNGGNQKRYPIGVFEQFLENSPARIKRVKIAQLPLPEIRKANHKVWDWFNEKLALCATADSGQRSEPDFALLCFAVERGIGRSEAWDRIKGVGKFAERGDGYFDLTWTAAEQQTRERIYEKAIAHTEKKAATNGKASANGKQHVTGVPLTPQVDLSEDKKICAELKIDVLGELPDGGVRIFSEEYGKTITLPRVVFQTVTDMLQKFGPIVREKVHTGTEEIPGMHKLKRVQEAIAVVGGSERAGAGAELGQGIWRSKNDLLILVNPKVGATWNGSTLEVVHKPRVADTKIDMDLPEEWRWFDHAKLAEYIEKAKDTAWSESVLSETATVFRKWNWKAEMEAAADLVAGLILCTFVESCWTWRPLVALTAESDSGKSLFFETLATIFGPLALLNAKSTEAGIRQAVGQHAKAILCDEFESDLHRDKILEFFRTASRGSQTLRGTSGQQAQRYGLRHIPWVAAVGIKLDRAPDRNRFIFLEFSPPPKDKRGKIELPQEPALADLGQKLLAIALRNVVAADRMSCRLKSLQIEGTHGRVIESFATPVAMLAQAIGLGDDEAKTLLINMVGKAQQDPGQATKDQTELLGEILSSEVYLEHGSRATVAQILKNPTGYLGGWDALERTGITVIGFGKNSQPLSVETDRKSLFIGERPVQRYLLKGTRWADEPIAQILGRLAGVKRGQHEVGGHRPRGVDIPWKMLREKYMIRDDEDGRVAF